MKRVKTCFLKLSLVISMLLTQINLMPLIVHAAEEDGLESHAVSEIEELGEDETTEVATEDIEDEVVEVVEEDEEAETEMIEEEIATEIEDEMATEDEEDVVLETEEDEALEEVELYNATRTMASGIVQFELRPIGNLPAGLTDTQVREALMNISTVIHPLFLKPGPVGDAATANHSDVATAINGNAGRASLFLEETATHYRVLIAGFEGWVAKEGAIQNVTIKINNTNHTISARAVAVFYPFGSFNHGQGRSDTSVPTEFNLIEFVDQTVPFVEDAPAPKAGQQVQSAPYYVNRGGTLHRVLTGNVTANLPMRPWAHIVGPAPSWMKADTPYYSFDGVFFYGNPRDIRVNGQGAVNAGNPHFNYFQYLSLRSQSSVSATDLNHFIWNNAQLTDAQRGKSVMINSGAYFINTQNEFGINATLQFAKAIHESNRGLSDIALKNNNLFGLNAVDSNPGLSADRFPNIQTAINDHANGWMSRGYLYSGDWRYAGPHVGHKGSGINVRYAMDPYWGEKIAGWAWRIDQASGGRDLNREIIGILQNNASTVVKNNAGSPLYTANSSGRFKFFPFLVTRRENNRFQIVTDPMIVNNSVTRDPAARFNHSLAVGFIPNTNIRTIGANVRQASVSYRTHVQNFGWQSWRSNKQISGTTGEGRRLEAIEIGLDSNWSGAIEYRTHVQNVGWQDWRSNKAVSGTMGNSLRLEAIEIRLTGEVAKQYDVYYRLHIENYGWLDWAKNGASSGSAGLGLQAEAIEVVLVERGANAPGNTKNPFIKANPDIVYSSHVQDVGWQASVRNGGMSGTTNQAKRLEAININLENMKFGGGIRYRTHIENVGWQGWMANGAISGSTGQALRMEAIQIELTGEISNYFNVYYRAHLQGIGWQNWVRNGELAGTTGEFRRLEAIEIRLERK